MGSPEPGDSGDADDLGARSSPRCHRVAGAGLSSGNPKPDGPAASAMVFTYDDIIAAPIGSSQHRVCDCPVMKHHRSRLGPSLMSRFEPGTIPGGVQNAFATGLFPLPRINVALNPHPKGRFSGFTKRTVTMGLQDVSTRMRPG